MIFEGTAGEERPLDTYEVAAVQAAAVATLDGRTEHLRVYEFAVLRGWKGASAGQSVDVLFNTYWGSGFAEEVSYLVVSPQQVGELFWVPLCGHTVDVKHAADIGNLAMLEREIGIGHHMKIGIEDRVCERAEDCTSVQTHCGGCDCGTPVARFAAERLEAQFAQLCATVRISEYCEMDCPPPEVSCMAGYCVAE